MLPKRPTEVVAVEVVTVAEEAAVQVEASKEADAVVKVTDSSIYHTY